MELFNAHANLSPPPPPLSSPRLGPRQVTRPLESASKQAERGRVANDWRPQIICSSRRLELASRRESCSAKAPGRLQLQLQLQMLMMMIIHKSGSPLSRQLSRSLLFFRPRFFPCALPAPREPCAPSPASPLASSSSFSFACSSGAFQLAGRPAISAPEAQERRRRQSGRLNFLRARDNKLRAAQSSERQISLAAHSSPLRPTCKLSQIGPARH